MPTLTATHLVFSSSHSLSQTHSYFFSLSLESFKHALSPQDIPDFYFSNSAWMWDVWVKKKKKKTGEKDFKLEFIICLLYCCVCVVCVCMHARVCACVRNIERDREKKETERQKG